MKLLYKLVNLINGFETAYRRIDFSEIKRDDLVLDVGSGGLPNPKADIICDFLESDFERSGEVLKVDRPFVWANIEKLPFKNRIFDYSILSHVLEHIANPEKALKEIERVSRAGYIETPNAFHEFVIPYPMHVSRCTVINNQLIVSIKKNKEETFEENLADVYHDALKCFWDLHLLNAKSLLTIYKWRDRINYLIKKEGKSAENFSEPPAEIPTAMEIPINNRRSFLKKVILNLIYWFLKPRKRINLAEILACPKCHGNLIFGGGLVSAECKYCNIQYGSHKGFLDFRMKNEK